jgi:N-acylneuraminate cytidylyltransferase/CMP-N,N'-diacetyllegionaminic acid synthase
LVSVSKTEAQNPAFLFKKDMTNRLQPITGFFPNSLRRQEIEDCFFIEGCLYISWLNSLLKNKGFLGPNTIAYEVPKWKSYEIDDIFDFKCVEAVMKELHKHEL